MRWTSICSTTCISKNWKQISLKAIDNFKISVLDYQAIFVFINYEIVVKFWLNYQLSQNRPFDIFLFSRYFHPTLLPTLVIIYNFSRMASCTLCYHCNTNTKKYKCFSFFFYSSASFPHSSTFLCLYFRHVRKKSIKIVIETIHVPVPPSPNFFLLT